MIAIFVPKASASSMLWVVTMSAELLLSSLMVLQSILLAYGSTPAEDSSKNITSGQPNIATAVHSFLLFPPLKLIDFVNKNEPS